MVLTWVLTKNYLLMRLLAASVFNIIQRCCLIKENAYDCASTEICQNLNWKFLIVLVQVQVLVLQSGPAPVQHHFGSVSEHFLDRTWSTCSTCSVVFVYCI